MINEIKIKKYCDRNGFSYRCFHDAVLITTYLDQWKLEFIDVYDGEIKEYREIIKVKHHNTMGNKTRKNHFHTQRLAYDIDFVFQNIIIPHEQGNRVYQKAFKIKELLAEHI